MSWKFSVHDSPWVKLILCSKMRCLAHVCKTGTFTELLLSVTPPGPATSESDFRDHQTLALLSTWGTELYRYRPVGQVVGSYLGTFRTGGWCSNQHQVAILSPETKQNFKNQFKINHVTTVRRGVKVWWLWNETLQRRMWENTDTI